MVWRIKSFERELVLAFLLVLSIELSLCIMLFAQLGRVNILVLFLGLIMLNGWLFYRIQKRANASFERVNNQLEAINENDYSLFARPTYEKGRIARLHKQLNILTERLQKDKSVFDQQMFLVYRLIDQLNTPILVFNQQMQLTNANSAFSDLYDRPWQAMQYAAPARLGLQYESNWHFLDQQKNDEWQIRHSNFVESGKRYQLLVFINIQTVLRETQLKAWKNLMRVMSHEIKNSLTPVTALAQGLREKELDTRNQNALNVIVERCEHLHTFVNRYAQLQHRVECKIQRLHAYTLFQKLSELFANIDMNATGLELELWADPILLEQVLINLVKNAAEAGTVNRRDSFTCSIQIRFSQCADVIEIVVEDNGTGIANPDNLFVPFYSTKPNGQGIGLALSRHLVEQMGGRLNLKNKREANGARACITLPSFTG